MSSIVELLTGILGGSLGAALGRGRMSKAAADRRVRKYREGDWFMIPLAVLHDDRLEGNEGRIQRKRRVFELRINVPSQGGYRLGWWDEGNLGPFADLIMTGIQRDLGEGLVALNRAISGGSACIEIQRGDLEIVRDVLARTHPPA